MVCQGNGPEGLGLGWNSQPESVWGEPTLSHAAHPHTWMSEWVVFQWLPEWHLSLLESTRQKPVWRKQNIVVLDLCHHIVNVVKLSQFVYVLAIYIYDSRSVNWTLKRLFIMFDVLQCSCSAHGPHCPLLKKPGVCIVWIYWVLQSVSSSELVTEPSPWLKSGPTLKPRGQSTYSICRC